MMIMLVGTVAAPSMESVSVTGAGSFQPVTENTAAKTVAISGTVTTFFRSNFTPSPRCSIAIATVYSRKLNGRFEIEA